MDPELKELGSQYEQKNARVNEILDAVGDGAFSREQQQEVSRLEGEMDEIKSQASESKELSDAAKDAKARATARKSNVPTNRPGMSGTSERELKTIGQHVIAELTGYLKTIKSADGSIQNDRRVSTPHVNVPGLLKTVLNGTPTSPGGAWVVPDRVPQVPNQVPFRPLVVRDLVTQGTTTSNTVDYAEITGYSQNAAVVGEANDTPGSGAAPESGLAGDVIYERVKEIAHYIPITKNALADAAQLMTLIDGLLMFGLQDTLEHEIVAGDGTGDHFLGILNRSNIQTQALVMGADGKPDLFTTIRKGRTKAKTPGRIIPNAILMHPYDWETFDLMKNAQGNFYFAGPSDLGNARLWGVPVIETEAAPVGKALMGDFRYATLWDRQAESISMSDSHADYFIRRLVAVLGTLRAAFGVLYPKAFIEISLA